MTGVALFVVVVIGIGLAAGYLGLTDGSITINTSFTVGGVFVAAVMFLIGGIFARDNSKARRVNGEIETKLQSFASKRTNAYGGKDYWDIVDKSKAEEAKFRETIEYGKETDGSENYWSYK